MAKKISNDSFIEPDFLKPIIKRFKDLLVVIGQLKENLKDTGKDSAKFLETLSPESNIKDYVKLNETLEKLKVAQEKLLKLQEEELKTKNNLKKAQDQKNKEDKEALDLAIKSNKVKQEEAKLLIQEKKAQQEQLKLKVANRKETERRFKELEKERKNKQKELTLYQQESKRLTELRNKYKDLAVAEQENTKEGRALLKEITKLDKKLKDIDESVGQNQRSVGNYKKALEGLNSTIGKLGLIAIVTKGFELLSGIFGESREGALALQIAFSKVTESVKVFVQSIINTGPGIVDIFNGFVNSFKRVGVSAELNFAKAKRAFTFGDAVKELDAEILALEKQLIELDKPLISQGIEKIGKAFEGNIDATKNATDAQEKYLELQLKTNIQIQQQERALAGLAEKRQILQDISDDDTIGFVTRAKAVKKAKEEAVKFAELENKLALTKEKLTIEAVKQDLRRAKALSESQISAIKNGEQLKAILQNEAIARKVSDANDESFTTAYIERKNKQVESEAFFRDQEEKNRITARDAFEQELDILEEFTEKRVASNEEIINDDTKTLEQRQKALKENQKLEKQLFDESIRLILEQGKASIDLRKDLTDAEKEKQKALLTTDAIQEIINTQDEQEIFNLIRKLDLGEIEEKRLKDSIKIKQDIAKVNKDSLKAEEEVRLKTEELQKDILLQEKKLNDEKFDLEDERLKQEKANLQKRIDLLEKDSIKRLELEKQLNELKLQEQEKANEEQEKKDKESLEKREKLLEESVELATEIFEKNNEKRLANIDKQLEAIEERQDSLRDLANNGNEEAVKSLADSQKREAEIRREKEKELQRQKRIEAGLAAFQVLASKSKDNPKTALVDTIKDVTTLSAVINALPAFFDGTENIEKSLGKGVLNTQKDAYLANVEGFGQIRLDGSERIIPGYINRDLGDMTNKELHRMIKGENGNIIINQNDNSHLLKELIATTKKNNLKSFEQSFNSRTGVLSEVYKYQNKNIVQHKKLFGK